MGENEKDTEIQRWRERLKRYKYKKPRQKNSKILSWVKMNQIQRYKETEMARKIKRYKYTKTKIQKFKDIMLGENETDTEIQRQ